MHPQGWLRLRPTLMLELPEASRADPVVLQRCWVSVHLASFEIGVGGISRKDGKDSKESAPVFEMYG